MTLHIDIVEVLFGIEQSFTPLFYEENILATLPAFAQNTDCGVLIG